MAAPPSEFFALRLQPGETIPLDLGRDFVITNVCFADPEEGEEEADDLPVGQTTVVKVHHIAMDGPGWGDEDSDDEDDEDEDDEDEEDEDEDEEGGPRADSEESGDTVEQQEKQEAKEVAVNGSIQKKAGAEGEDEEEEDDDSLDFSEIEEKVYSLCRLTTGRIEQATVNVQICAEELISLSVSGKNARAVDVLGTYLAAPGAYNTEPDDDELMYDSDASDLAAEDYDSEELEALREAYGEEEDDGESEDDDEEDESGPEVEEFSDDDEEGEEGLHEELAALLNGDVDDEDDEDDERFEVVDEKPASKVTGKKRRAEDDAEDEDMADASGAGAVDAHVTAEELHAAAAAEGIDISQLSKNQRKRLNKKLKAQGGAAVAPDTAKEAAPKTQKSAAAPAAKESKPAAAAAPAASAAVGKKQTLPSGLVIEDKKAGSGPQAKAGNKVSMRYIGKFKDGKIFDSNTKGSPFSFRLGKGEVIKGWDIGVAGMTVGSERRLTVPPSLGYGKQKTGPIPANSTLIFDVKLLAIK